MKSITEDTTSISYLQGGMVEFPEDEDTPQKRVNKIFQEMDLVSSYITYHYYDYHISLVESRWTIEFGRVLSRSWR